MEKTIAFDNIDHVMNLFGSQDENVKAIESIMAVNIVPRGTEIKRSDLVWGQLQEDMQTRSM